MEKRSRGVEHVVILTCPRSWTDDQTRMLAERLLTETPSSVGVGIAFSDAVSYIYDDVRVVNHED